MFALFFFFISGEVDELIKKFKATSISDSSNTDEIILLLQSISTSAESDPSQYENIELTDCLLQILTSSRANNGLREHLAKAIAEVTKSDGQRKRFTDTAVLRELLKLLEGLSNETLKVAIQSCRALGNICYHNDDARNMILASNGDAILISLLDFSVNASDETHLSFGKLRGGLISNYLVGGEHLAKHAMELNIMNKIESIVNACSADIEKNDDVLLHTLPLLSLLTENVSDLNFSATLNSQLARILAVSKNPDVAEICLEMLHYQAENGN